MLWKGAAYDDYFSLQDRLINLYKRGMKEFFDDEVASVENAEIEDAFKFLTSKDFMRQGIRLKGISVSSDISIITLLPSSMCIMSSCSIRMLSY